MRKVLNWQEKLKWKLSVLILSAVPERCCISAVSRGQRSAHLTNGLAAVFKSNISISGLKSEAVMFLNY